MMKRFPIRAKQTEEKEEPEQISLSGYFQRRKSFFAIFLIACAMLVAVFAAVYVWADGGEGWRDQGGFPGSTAAEEEGAETPVEESDATDTEAAETSEKEEVSLPEDTGGLRTPIREMELARGEGVYSIRNESDCAPDIGALLARDVSSKNGEEPLVLILHTHTTEGYLSMPLDEIGGDLSEATYTADADRSVLAVGRMLAKTLRDRGISAIHCTTVHDASGMRGAYDAAAESIRFFLSLYPSIRYVIDLHRDAILDADGAYVRTVSETEDGRCAQILPVVGVDGRESERGTWEGNLALALQLRRALNGEERSICRPVVLRNASYNQELSPFSLLLEIGTGGNEIREAEQAAVLLGNALSALIVK